MSKSVLQGAVTALDSYISTQLSSVVDIAVKICIPADVITPITYARGVKQFAKICELAPATVRRVLNKGNKHRPSSRTTTNITIAAQQWGLVPSELIHNMNAIRLQSDGNGGFTVEKAIA